MPVVTQPTARQVHVNRPLTNFLLAWITGEDKYACYRSIPRVRSTFQTNTYYELPREFWLRDEARERADGTPTAGGKWMVDEASMFRCPVIGYHEDLGDQTRYNQDEILDVERAKTLIVGQKLMINGERRWTEQIFSNTGDRWGATNVVNWTNAEVNGVMPTDPIVDIRQQVTAIQKRTGYAGNTLILAKDQHDVLLDNDSLIERIAGGATTNLPAEVMNRLIMSLIPDLKAVHVTGAVYNPSLEGAAAQDIGFIGTSGGALVAYLSKDASPSRYTPTAAVRFWWTRYGDMGRIRKFRCAEELGTDRIEGEYASDWRVTAADMGAWFQQAAA